MGAVEIVGAFIVHWAMIAFYAWIVVMIYRTFKIVDSINNRLGKFEESFRVMNSSNKE